MGVKLGYGTTFSHADASGNLLELSGIGETWEKIDSTHMSTEDAATYIADAIKETNEVTGTVQLTDGLPEGGGDATPLVIVLPADPPITLTVPAFVMSWKLDPKRKEIMAYEVVWCPSGEMVRS